MKQMIGAWLRLGLMLLPLGWLLPLAAEPVTVSESELVPSAQQRQTAMIIGKVVEKFHYRKVVLDDQMSSSMFDRYLESLDPNKSFFSAVDLAALEKNRHTLDDDLRHADLDIAFQIFKLFRQRVEDRVEFALQRLEQGQFDFTRDEQYRFNREKAEWAADTAALDDLWRKRIKNDIISLRLSGKDEEKIQETLRKRYEGIRRRVRQFNTDDVFQTFINAFTLSIEPHTSYMSPVTSENFDINMSLSLQGIGAVLRSDNEDTVVQRVVPGGPAGKSGQLHAGDRIIGVAQGEKGEMEDVVGWRLQDVVGKIRGPKGSVVRLNVLPKSAGSDGPAKEILLVRDEIKLEDQAASSSVLKGLPGLDELKIGVIEVPAFYRDFRGHAEGQTDFRSTTRDVRELLGKLQADKVDGIIIDLRDNGGGSLAEATELTGLFIEQGPVVQVKDSSGQVELEEDKDPEQIYKGPLVVLVDRNSASASEIFAGAIQDYRRGLIIGEPTFGKGTVQTLVDIGRYTRADDDLGRLRLTMAQFFRVAGASTQHRGVTPDVVFSTADGSGKHGERALDNALPWAAIEPAKHVVGELGNLDSLLDKHRLRVANDPAFQYLVTQEQELQELQAQESVSLVEKARHDEWQLREQKRLERRNRLREYRGLEPLDSLKKEEDEQFVERSKDEEDPEGVNRIMVEEAARVLTDYLLVNAPRTAQAK